MRGAYSSSLFRGEDLAKGVGSGARAQACFWCDVQVEKEERIPVVLTKREDSL